VRGFNLKPLPYLDKFQVCAFPKIKNGDYLHAIGHPVYKTKMETIITKSIVSRRVASNIYYIQKKSSLRRT